MSKALDYLLAARPEAMEAYFTFLKRAGEHLDKKTAALISVITKVHAKTANGLRQYLPRALKAGATADEVIDALLFAMPALGFSKIVWAIDVILEMDLPEFRHVAGTKKEPSWQVLGDSALLQKDTPTLMKIGANSYYAVTVDGRPAVYSATCPHQRNIIPQSGADGMTLTCPFHEWKFDLKSGACISGGKTPLTSFESKIEGGKVWVKI